MAMEVENCSNKFEEISKFNISLIDVVFSWGLDDVLNDDLLKSKMVEIPLSFHSQDHYFESFKYPLMEETRALISTNLRNIDRAPFAGVTSLRRSDSESDLTYNVSVDYWRSSSRKMAYTMSSGDIFILTDAIPGEMEFLEVEGRVWIFASVSRLNDDDENGISFTVKLSKGFKSKNNFDGNSPLYAVFLANVKTHERIWNVLCMQRKTSIIDSILHSKIKEKSGLDLKSHSCSAMGLIDEVLSLKLGESQSKALLASVCSIKCYKNKPVQLMYGPPGSGKTHTLSALVLVLSRIEIKTLVCASSNLSTAQSACYVLKLAKEFPPCLLDSFLFKGNKELLRDYPEIEGILLLSRAEGLLKAFEPYLNWRSCFRESIGFLRNENSVENEALLRDKFASNVSTLRSFFSMLCSNFPLNSVTRDVFALMDSLVSAFNSTMMNSISVRSLMKKLFRLLDDLIPSVLNKSTVEKLCMRLSMVIFCTASSSYEFLSLRMKPVKALVIDDAQQLRDCESLIPLQLLGLDNVFLFGDQNQMPASVASKIAAGFCFGRSLFDRLSLIDYPKHFLNMQYRMHPLISLFPRTKFYKNLIIDSPNVRDESYVKSYLPGLLFGPYSFINISCGNEDVDDIHCSRKNIVEVAVSTEIVRSVYKAWKISKKRLSIGLTSPYTAQIIEIQEKLGQKYNGLNGFIVEAIPINELHCKEVDILILSTVRSNSEGSLGYLSNHQMTNLVLTRARHCLWILGHEKTLSKGESIWKDIVCDANDRGVLFNIEQDNELSKFVLEVKKELDELDELLVGDSFIFSNATWKILFSGNFKKSFVKIESSQLKKSVIHLLLKLSHGWRRRNVDVICERSRHILKQFNVKDLYAICSVDIVKESSYSQVLRVWDLLPLCDIPALVKRLDAVFLTYTKNFLNLCKIKCVQGDLEIPMSWEKSSDIVRYKKRLKASQKALVQLGDDGISNDSSSMESDLKVSDSLLVMKFYAFSSGMVGHMLSSCEGTEAELPFELTSKEIEVIQFDRSSFILGRSGTGKTTVLIRKLAQREQLYHIASKGFHERNECASQDITNEGDEIKTREIDDSFLRQIFVTNSPRLCFAVKQHVSGLKRYSNPGTSEDDCRQIPFDYIDDSSQFKDIPNSFVDLPQTVFPLVITFHKFLIMLDETLGDSFFDKFPEINGHSLRSSKRRRESMAMETFIRKKGVGFEKFRSSYWPSFTVDITSGLEPLKVFAEIMSHIKDGLKRGNLHYGELSQKEYFLHSRSRVSSISAQQCEKIFKIFLQYEKKKTEMGEYDLADLVTHIHCRLRDNGYRGEKFDYVYIDEVQDLTMSQIALFKYICRNVDEGFVFAGDTAQTIAKGIDFRFEDIRCLFYREFLLKSNSRSYRKGDKGLVAESFHLSQNFRTHSRILKLAQSITDLLCHFFPRSIDALSPETSLIDGETPLLVEFSSSETDYSSMFTNAQDSNINLVGFGAEQVILVRDDNAKEEILKSVGKNALVLTIEECKGLEFEDVILVNFLSSSPAKNEWRVMLEYMKDKSPLLHENTTESFPVFCETKHRVLCSELKQLYVAITRTRQRLWIFEDTDVLHDSILYEYWKKIKIVEARRFDIALMNKIQVTSTREEWISRGIKLFHAQNYGAAKICFVKGRDSLWEKRAEAAGLQFSALNIYSSLPIMAHACLKKAAEIFESIGKYEQAAQCFFDSKEYERAGEIYWGKIGVLRLAEAGECFALAGCFERASIAYAKGNFFSKCLDSCDWGKLYDVGLSYIVSWRDEVHEYKEKIEASAQVFLESAALNYEWLKDNTTAMKFVRSFHSRDSMRKFLSGKPFFIDELLKLETEWGCFLKAADLAKQMGKTILRAELLEKAKYFEEASSVLLSYVLVNSLWAPGMFGWPLKQFEDKKELLNKAKALARNVSAEFFDLVSTEEKVLSDNSVALFVMKNLLNDSKRHSSFGGVVLCARKILDFHFNHHESRYAWRDDGRDFLSGDQVCVDTLFHYWNVWKEKIEKVLEFLRSRDRLENTTNVYAKFVLDFFGVTMTKESGEKDTIFNLIVPNAYWVKKIDERYLLRHGDSVCLRADHLSEAAEKYWKSEILSVGDKVLRKLTCLYYNSKKKSAPLHFQMKPLLHTFEAAKFLISLSKSGAGHYYKKLESMNDNFLRSMFPMDSRNSLTLQMMKLRETKKSRDILDNIIRQSIKWKNSITYKKVGDVAMAIFVRSGKLCDETYEKICSAFDEFPFWSSCIENYWNERSESPDTSSAFDPRIHVSVVRALHEALKHTYYAESFGRNGSMSPMCFVYLVERLINMIFYFKGCFISTKSSFLEWVVNRDWYNENGMVNFEEDYQSEFVDALEFVASAIFELLRNGDEVFIWIQNSKLGQECHSSLVLRLFIALCLVCLNSVKYYNLLFEILDGSDIVSQLPREFYNTVRNLNRINVDHNVNTLAQAFRKIQNPMVVITSRRQSCVGSKSANAITVDLRTHHGPREKEEVIDKLLNS